jgi:ferredoxin/coenzyme F420-reducing hydrogenase delta subunit
MELDPAKIDPKHLKISFLPRGEEMSRRDLLFGLLKPQYEIVPAVEEERCIAWCGCSFCVASCPQEAISLKEASASIDKDKCTACGACLPACPEQAISSPLLDLEVVDSLLQSLLRREETDLGAKVLLIITEDANTSIKTTIGSLGPALVELKLPCIGAVSPWLLLRSFDLGADAVAVIPCGSTCRHRCKPERWQRTMRFIQALLVKIGIDPERMQVFSLPGEESQSLIDLLRGFVDGIREIGPTGLRNGKEKAKLLSLAALLKDLGQRFNLDGSRISGDDTPFGIVSVDSGCTLCGACMDSCPTGAITLQEGADLSKLLFDHGRCVGCEACVKVCPEEVLRVEKTLDFSRLGESTVLAEDRMARCRRCGKEIAPLAMMRKIQAQLAGRKTGTPTGLGEFCPDCRIFGSL